MAPASSGTSRSWRGSTLSTRSASCRCSGSESRGGGANDPYAGDYPVFAIRILQHESCGRRYGGGGAWNRARGGLYMPWIESFIRGLDPIGRRAAVIVEPDGLAVIPDCVSRRGAKRRLALMRAVLKRLGREPGLTTYVDIGSSTWLRRGQALRLLRRSGVARVRGFALNTTHFNRTASELRYGNWLAKKLGGKHFVVNTAENGRGAAKGPKNFCNPANAGLGSLPATRTASKYADAYLWLSRPGLSSNGHGGQSQCGRGPGGNVFWETKAFGEASKAVFTRAPWPPAAL